MMRSKIYVKNSTGWMPFDGPTFVSERKAKAWAREVCDDLAGRGRECSVIVWDHWNHEVVCQWQSRLLASVN